MNAGRYSLTNDVLPALRRKNYVVFDNSSYALNLNIVGIRKDKQKVNEFNDELYVFWRTIGSYNHWNTKVYKITTVPGKHWLINLLNPNGTAVLVPGQYRGTYKVGLHRGKDALVQYKPVAVYRDKNKDLNVDYDDSTIQLGNFGINIHRAAEEDITKYINMWSAGCQVFQHIYDYKEFIGLCRQSAEIYGNSLTYTLLKEKDLIT